MLGTTAEVVGLEGLEKLTGKVGDRLDRVPRVAGGAEDVVLAMMDIDHRAPGAGQAVLARTLGNGRAEKADILGVAAGRKGNGGKHRKPRGGIAALGIVHDQKRIVGRRLQLGGKLTGVVVQGDLHTADRLLFDHLKGKLKIGRHMGTAEAKHTSKLLLGGHLFNRQHKSFSLRYTSP